jgi:hypothetical protein
MKIMRQSLKLGFPKGASTQKREGKNSEMLDLSPKLIFYYR